MPIPEEDRRCIYAHLDDIRGLFTKPEEVKVTLIVRTPWMEDGGVLVSDDEDEKSMAEFHRLSTKEGVR